MARNQRFHNKQHKRQARSAPALAPVAVRSEKKPPVVYGKPFTVLEDEQKNTFEYKAGTWVPYEMSIAQCREQYQVNELPQKVNRMTRYEVRCPVAMAN